MPDNYELIPEHTMAALKRYTEERIQPGDFLYAVLTNDLQEAFARADVENVLAIGPLVRWIYNNEPGTCWGSREKVEAWLAKGRAERKAATGTVRPAVEVTVTGVVGDEETPGAPSSKFVMVLPTDYAGESGLGVLLYLNEFEAKTVKGGEKVRIVFTPGETFCRLDRDAPGRVS